jgi:hypothetical protein
MDWFEACLKSDCETARRENDQYIYWRMKNGQCWRYYKDSRQPSELVNDVRYFEGYHDWEPVIMGAQYVFNC